MHGNAKIHFTCATANVAIYYKHFNPLHDEFQK